MFNESLLIFASLISPSKMILFEKKYQTFDTVFHLEVRQKYSATRRIFNSLLGVSSGDETLRLMFGILLEEEKTTTRQQPTKNVVDGKDFVKLTKKALKLGAESLDFSGAPNINFRKISVRETI